MNVNPQLYNFRIDEVINRVYFDSSKLINGGLSGTNGFKIEGKFISGLSLNVGSLTDHYFELSANLNFWDNLLIRYEGVADGNESDITDLAGKPLLDFRLQYVENILAEPESTNIKYAAPTTQGAGTGLDEANAWSYSTATATATAGTTVRMLAGSYSGGMTISNNGTSTNPIKFIGYNNAGKDVNRDRSVGMTFDSSVMPLISNATDAITAVSKSYVIIRNMQFSGNSNYCLNTKNATNCIFDNLYMSDGERGFGGVLSYSSTKNRILNSYVADMSKSGITLTGDTNLIKNTWAVTSKTSGMDYYLSLLGSTNGGNSAIIDSYVNRLSGESHSGHGISLKANKDDSYPNNQLEYSLVENCDIVNSRFEFRHDSVQYNVFRNSTLSNNVGIVLGDGASYNIAENIYMTNVLIGFRWYESSESLGRNINGHHNKFINVVVDGATVIVENEIYTGDGYTGGQEPLIQNNDWINCVFRNVPNFGGLQHSVVLDNTNTVANSILDNVDAKASNIQTKWEYSDFYNGFAIPSGTGNIDEDPIFSPFPTATNPELQIGALVQGAEYDSEGNQRYAPVTLGSVQIVVVGETSIIKWTKSVASGLIETVVYRDDLEIGRVPAAAPQIFYDTVDVDIPYKYTVQAVNEFGESVAEVDDVNTEIFEIVTL